MQIKIEDIIDVIEMMDQHSEAFLNEKTGEIEWINEMSMSQTEIAEIYDRLEEDGFYRLPTQYDIDEYNIIEDFIVNLPHSREKEELSEAITGTGAYGRFKDTLEELGLADDWYDFQGAAFKRLAEDWCIDNQVEFA